MAVSAQQVRDLTERLEATEQRLAEVERRLESLPAPVDRRPGRAPDKS